MSRPIPPEVDPLGFEATLGNCGMSLRDMVAYLRSTAEHAGRNVTPRRYKHPAPNRGWGITYYNGDTPFFQIHPRGDSHVWVFVRGADPADIEAEGFQRSKQKGWFMIHTMAEAERFAKWILKAHVGAAG